MKPYRALDSIDKPMTACIIIFGGEPRNPLEKTYPLTYTLMLSMGNPDLDLLLVLVAQKMTLNGSILHDNRKIRHINLVPDSNAEA